VNDISLRIQGAVTGAAIGAARGEPVRGYSLQQIHDKYGPDGIIRYDIGRDGYTAKLPEEYRMMLYTINGLLLPDAVHSPLKRVQMAWQEFKALQKGVEAQPYCCWISENVHMFTGVIPKPSILSVVPMALWVKDSPLTAIRMAVEAASENPASEQFAGAALVNCLYQVIHGDKLENAIPESIQRLTALYGDSRRAILDNIAGLMELALMLSKNESSPNDTNIELLSQPAIVYPSLAIGLYSALRYPNDCSRAITVAVNQAGDSVISGAIAGCLVGAQKGILEIDENEGGNDELMFSGLELLSVVWVLGRDLACAGSD